MTAQRPAPAVDPIMHSSPRTAAQTTAPEKHRRTGAASAGAAAERRGSPDGARRRVRAAIAGLLAVVAVLFAAGVALGPLRSLLVLGAPSTFAMPVVAAVSDWGAGVRPSRRGAWLFNSALILLAAAVLPLVGQIVVGHIDLAGALRGAPITRQRDFPTFPYLIPVGALAFVGFLQLSIVSEGRVTLPARFGPIAGRCALLSCESAAVVAYLSLANWNTVPATVRSQIGLRNPGGPWSALDIATWLIAVSVWQTAYLLFDGWPYSRIARRPLRIAVANVAVVGLGSATYWLGRSVVGATGPQLAAAGAMTISGGLLVGPLYRVWSERAIGTGRGRATSAASAIMVAAGLYAGLRALGLSLSTGWTSTAPVELWIVICGLNLISGSVLWYTRLVLSPPDAGA